MPRSRRWTDQQLADAVAASSTLSEVCRRLGIRPGRYDLLRRHIARIGVDASHLPDSTPRPTRERRWTDDELRAAVAAAVTVSAVLRALGYRPGGGTHRLIVGHIRRLGLDTSHFLGRAATRGRRFPGRTTKIPLEAVLVAPSTYPSGVLRRRLVAEGVKAAHCDVCGADRWRGQVLPLSLDHINGDHTDHRLENLRILCPNCYALTSTSCGRKRSRPV